MKVKNSVIIGLALFSIMVSVIAVSSIKSEVKAQESKPLVGHIILYEAGSTSGGSPSQSTGASYAVGASYVWRGTKSFIENLFFPGTSCIVRVKCCYTLLEATCNIRLSSCENIANGTAGSCFDGISANLGDYEYKIDCTTAVENAELNHVSVSYKC